MVSVDTFFADVACQAVEAGAHIVNDVSGGTLDSDMFKEVRSSCDGPADDDQGHARLLLRADYELRNARLLSSLPAPCFTCCAQVMLLLLVWSWVPDS